MDDTVTVTTPKSKNPNRVAWAHELNRRKKMAKTVDQHIETQSQTVDQHSETVTGTFTKYLPWGIAGLCITAINFKERIMHIFPKSLQSEMSSMEDQKNEALLPTAASRRPIGNPFDQS